MAIAINRRGFAFLEYCPIPEHTLDPDSYSPLIITFAAIRYKDSYLLVHHRNRQSWELPGGHIEDGESPRDCAIRELFEETCQTVNNLNFRAVMKYHNPSKDRYYYGTLYSGELSSPVPFRANDEISQITFWDGKTDIGYVDEIDVAVLDIIRADNI